ncbi:F0F1 ATP synthase subunit delta [Williamsia sp.]|uniref:F0F1 ATP synthase subunit delta n=1 Tax=Williamsia sp. TaxID=1872085 RepID=UPI002F92D7A5
MYAASRDALSGTRTVLAETISAAGGDTATAAQQIGSDLFAVVGFLDSERSLRTAFGDISAPVDVRQGLANQLFGSQIEAGALAVVVEAVGRDWSNTSDLLSGLELLGREAYLKSASESGALDRIEEELFLLGRQVAGHPDLEIVLADKSRSAKARQELLATLTTGKVSAITEALAQQAIGRLFDEKPADVLDALSNLAAGQRDRLVAKVRASVDLTGSQVEALTATLTRIYNQPIVTHIVVDQDLLSGMVIRVGDEVIDGSGAGRLATIRKSLG